MSWHFSQALEAAFSEENFSDGKPSALWNSTPFVLDDSSSGKMKAIFHRSPYGTMFVPSTDFLGAVLLMWYLGDFLVKGFPSQEKAEDLTMNIPVSGKKWAASFAKLDRHLCSWKIPHFLPGVASTEFSGTWPRWGSMQYGECWELTTPELPKRGKESGFWPTPTKSDAGQRRKKRYSQGGLPLSFVLGGAWNPPWTEWLMDWPINWTAVEPLAKDRFQQWLDLHGIS
ncbi:hypothetical protein LEP1GSC109_2992 [Leptospira interrogans str. UI 13372]|nr:hypothetical protein LEP1GSC112_0078 [Leptospira interrogans serovar Pomona str. UT364]EMO94314.1 hypothetical protein LEP1GSC109_2992 [Leptospira interrogans str. UI 13372]